MFVRLDLILFVVILSSNGWFGNGHPIYNEIDRSEIELMKAEMSKLRNELEETKEKVQILSENGQISKTEVISAHGGRHERLLTETSVVHQMQIDMQNLKSSVATLQNMKSDISNLQSQITSLQSPKVGFTAVLRQDVSNLGDNQVIVFDRVNTNVGNDYNPYTGVFTCRVPGFYVFYVHTLAEPGKHVETVMVKNQQVMAHTYAYDKEYFSSGGNMAVMDLQKGDTVVIKSNAHEHDHDGAILDYNYTSFSGFLINTLK